MASEIKVSMSLVVTKGFHTFSRSLQSLTFTLTGTSLGAGIQAIGFAAHEILDVNADVGSGGWAIFRNLDSVNYLELGVDSGGTFYPLARLNAGEPALMRVTTAAVYARANTAACDLEYQIYEN